MSTEQQYLHSSIKQFRTYKELAQKAIAQIGENDLNKIIDPESNSIAIIIQHLGGNLISRWTDFLTTDGEKTDRNRDAEFEEKCLTKNELMDYWNKGWDTLFETLDELQPEDLGKTIYIRKQPLTVLEAINRQLTHYAYHVGQIVLLAKHFNSSGWQSLSIPKGDSQSYNKTHGL